MQVGTEPHAPSSFLRIRKAPFAVYRWRCTATPSVLVDQGASEVEVDPPATASSKVKLQTPRIDANCYTCDPHGWCEMK
jgi:hypothetical protein